VPPASAIPRMAGLAQSIIKDTLDAYIAGDAEKAIDVWLRDEEVDEMYTGLFRELLTYMMEDPRNITPCTHLLFIAKNIERMGDHATNIAETIHYMVTGRRMEGRRPKGDETSFQLVQAPEGETAKDQSSAAESGKKETRR
ncbi:MAG: phosphate uptake regulator PhoU, partial [Kiloniellales bacterium]